EICPEASWFERNLKCCFHIDRGAILQRWFELPLRNRLAGKSVQTIVHSSQDTHISDGSVGMDDSIKNYSAGNVLAHELDRVSGIHLARCHWLREIRRRSASLVTARVVLQLSKADDPASAGGI